MRPKQKAANAGGFGKLWRATETPSQENGLRTNFKSACIRAHGRGMMPVPCSIARLGLGGSNENLGEQSPRHYVAFFFWRLFVALMALLRPHHLRACRAGSLRACRSLGLRSANPHGTAHHLGGCVGGYLQFDLGA